MCCPFCASSVESKLFFKQPTSWRPRISRDLMISVASEMSRQNPSPNERVPQLPVQVSSDSLRVVLTSTWFFPNFFQIFRS